VTTGGNNPKVLVEFTPEEITWLADILHARWAAAVNLGTQGASEKLEKDKRINNEIRNRILDKASDQGFGNL